MLRGRVVRSEEHTSELQSLTNLVCRLLLEKKNHTSELQSLPNPERCLSLSTTASPSRSLRGSGALATLAPRRRRPGPPRDFPAFRARPRSAPPQPRRCPARRSAPSRAFAV